MKVVVVEDDGVARLKLKRLLARFTSWSVYEATNGEEGLEVITRESPDLVICDLCMPVMDGVTMIQSLRARPEHAALPIVAISASNDKETVLRLLDLKITDYLIKPFALEATSKRLGRLLSTLVPKPALGRVPEVGPTPDIGPLNAEAAAIDSAP